MSEETLRKLAMQVRNWGKLGAGRRDRHPELHHAGHDRRGVPARHGRQGVRARHPAGAQRAAERHPRSASTRSTPCSATAATAPRTPAEVAEMQGYGGSDDWIVMPLQCVTQWDSLAHVFYEGKMWNGYDAALVTSSGAAKNSIDKTKDKIVGPRRAARRRALQGRAGAGARLRDHAGRPGGDRGRRRRSRSSAATSCSSAPAT